MTTRTWLAPYLLLTALWGASFLAYRTAARVGHLAACHRGGPDLQRRPVRALRGAQTHISSVLAGIWNATTPLWTVVMGLLLVPGVRPTRPVVLGLLTGFVGVVVVLGPWAAVGDGWGSGFVLGTSACLAATACYGFAVTYTGKHLTGRAGTSPAQLPAAQLLVASAALSIIAVPLGDSPDAVPVTVVLSMLGLGVLGTGLAYVLLYRVVALAGATRASTVTYLIPLVSTTLGIAVLGESLTWNQPVGAALVLGGAWLTRPRGSSARSRPLQRSEEPRSA